MDILTDYRINAATSRERELSVAAERVRVAQERAQESLLAGRAPARTATASAPGFGRTGTVPCTPATH